MYEVRKTLQVSWTIFLHGRGNGDISAVTGGFLVGVGMNIRHSTAGYGDGFTGQDHRECRYNGNSLAGITRVRPVQITQLHNSPTSETSRVSW